MPGTYEITFLPEGRVEEFFGSAGLYYEFADGSRLRLETTPVWCRRCGGITEGERVESLEQLDKDLADLQDPTSFLRQITGRRFLRERIRMAEARRSWRVSRTSPAKCVYCGSADIVVLPHGEPAAHPAGDGTITVCCIGICSTSFMNWFFTPEGERIPRDTKPTYWRLRGS